MKNVWIVVMMSVSIITTYAQDVQDTTKTKIAKYDWSVAFESQPYAPITGATIGETPVIIGQLSATISKTNTSIRYWKSFDLIGDDEGSYDALFVIQPFKLGKQRLRAKYIHFADLTFERGGQQVFALQAYGGKKVRWSVQLQEFVYHSRSPRWVLYPSLSYKQWTINSWTYYDLGLWSQSVGIQYKSPKITLSPEYDAQLSILYNQSLSQQGFGQDQTAMIGITFTPKAK
jgi:hypothetical protein